MKERIELVRAMDCIIRHANDESIIEPWLILGVADGDADLPDEDLKSYTDDETFQELMDLFLNCVDMIRDSGGLFCDGVVTKAG